MKQKAPGATPADIRSGLIASATPMNAAAPGTWDAQAGYGLIDAVKAISAVDVLRVAATDPANGSTVTVTPSGITVTFNKPVVFSSVSKNDVVFQSTPTGVTVILGTPQAIDDPKNPTQSALPVHLRLHDASHHNGQRHLHLHRNRFGRFHGRQGAGPSARSPSSSTTRPRRPSQTPRSSPAW